MWYLCRTPHSAPNSQSNDFSDFTLRDSIFPVSDAGIFEEISIVQVQNKHNTDHTNDANGDKESDPYASAKWEWFAYPYSPTQFHSVAVPQNLSIKTQLIAVLPEHFLFAKLDPGPVQHAILCAYSRISCTWQDVPKMHCEDWNPIGAAGALLDGWLYLAGGYKDVEPSTYLNSAERLNLKTWEWQALPPMQTTRAFATGLSHRGGFFVVGGGNLRHSAEIYHPDSNSWLSLKSFVPKEAKGFSVASVQGRLVILTWSDQLGVKLWLWTVLVNPILIAGWRLISFFPNHDVERVRLRKHGAENGSSWQGSVGYGGREWKYMPSGWILRMASIPSPRCLDLVTGMKWCVRAISMAFRFRMVVD
ncbi:hypothetical protein L1049_012921 [Liquidambar formosana]|uniref:Uncharacterized protein n=1 Tax=Liquidambar formosana TaxID=63359 RepID=A0AAP0RKT2_LIQFO